MNKITFIIHGKHRNNTSLISGIRSVFSNQYEVVFSFTERIGHATQLSKEAAQSNSQYIIGVCGDGVLNEMINGVMLSGNKDVIAGLLPYGTGNDFAKTIQVTNDIVSLKQMLDSNKVKQLDLGLVNYKNEEGVAAQRYFDNITDVGIGGFAALKMSGSTKMLGAFLTFQWVIVSTFLSYKHQHAKITFGDFTYEGKILSCIIANGKYFGAGLGIAPGAKPDDGLFEVVMATEISLWDYLKNLGNVRKCLKINHPYMNYLSAKEVMVETPGKKLPIDMDGEFIGYSPMKVTIAPKAIKFICPL